MTQANPAHFIPYIILALALQLIYSCSNDNAKFIAGTNSVVNHIENDSNYTLFLQAIEGAGLRGEWDANFGNNTFLIPDNNAVQEYMGNCGISNLTELSADELRQFVNYHRTEDIISLENFATGYRPTLAEVATTDSTVANLRVFINRTMDSLSFNGMTHIIKADVPVDNGILHVIDRALPLPTVQTFLAADPGLSSFYERFIHRNDTLSTVLDGAEPGKKITLFVPHNFAVEEFFKDMMSPKPADSLQVILKYHFLKNPQLLGNLETGYYPTLATEEYSGKNHNLSLYIVTDEELQVGQGSAVLTPDLMTVNGNIEILDQVLIPPTIADIIEVDTDLKQFYELLSETGMQNDLRVDSGESYTVFAPTDEAFRQFLKIRFPDEEKPDMSLLTTKEQKELLQNHIVKGGVLLSESSRNAELTTLNDKKLKLSKRGVARADKDMEAGFVVRDIQTLNGVVHCIDAVLMPEE